MLVCLQKLQLHPIPDLKKEVFHFFKTILVEANFLRASNRVLEEQHSIAE
jgi:hypothetical protein